MVNFTCPLDQAEGCPESWLNAISGCICQSVFERGQHLNRQKEQRFYLQCGYGGHQPVYMGPHPPQVWREGCLYLRRSVHFLSSNPTSICQPSSFPPVTQSDSIIHYFINLFINSAHQSLRVAKFIYCSPRKAVFPFCPQACSLAWREESLPWAHN